MAFNSNPGYAFPLEKLGSDIARNQYNYESILNGLIEWNTTESDTVTIRLTKDTDPWYQDYVIPSRNSVMNSNNGYLCNVTGQVQPDCFAIGCMLDVALSGGTRLLTDTTFDATVGQDIDTGVTPNEITIADATGFAEGDFIKFESNGNTMPSGLDETTIYTIYSLAGNVITIGDENGAVINSLDGGSTGDGTITMVKRMESTIENPADPGDVLTLRATVGNAGGATWQVWFEHLVREWTSGDTYTYGNIVRYNDALYRLAFDEVNSTIDPNTDTVNFVPVVTDWVSGGSYIVNQLVDYNGSIYVTLVNNTYSLIYPDADTTTFALYAPAWVIGTNYIAGNFVAYDKIPYIATLDVPSSNNNPLIDTDNWLPSYSEPMPTAYPFAATQVFKWSLPYDVSAIYLRNEGTTVASPLTQITLQASSRAKQPESIYQRTTGFFKTSNYSMWPKDTSSLWQIGTQYDTDIARSPGLRQNHSAVMVFDHSRMDVAKTINYINYDGPDLDQGLCIYLPSEVETGLGTVAYPEDGFTFEFFLRIWPNPTYTGARTRDHIINKAQIYVYDAPNYEQIENDTCNRVIAKFSMARMTNFYMFGENITIPDKPVCYRATFAYSAALNQWTLLDYYQLPDHIFMGPVGFIDPQNPANLDINATIIGDGNPNPQTIGYETAGFPMFQDPFSNTDLTPFRDVDGTDDGYTLRIV